jgi:hypothetical protein
MWRPRPEVFVDAERLHGVVGETEELRIALVADMQAGTGSMPRMYIAVGPHQAERQKFLHAIEIWHAQSRIGAVGCFDPWHGGHSLGYLYVKFSIA